MQTRELCSGSVLQERAAGASSLVCTGLYSLLRCSSVQPFCAMISFLFIQAPFGFKRSLGVCLNNRAPLRNSKRANYFIDGFHLTSRWPCWCTEQCSKMSFGNLTLLLCKTCGTIFYCFVHQHGRLITWMQTKNYYTIQLEHC